MAAGRKALVVATYEYSDSGLSQLAAPAHDAESFAAVLQDPSIAGFDVTMLVNKPHYEVGEAIADFYTDSHRGDLTLLYFTGHGVKDDQGRLYLAMNNTRREALMFTAISAAQLNDAMDASTSRRKVLILDCCYSGAFPAGRTAKSDEGVQTLERFQGKGRAVLTASDATQYAFEGDDLRGTGTSSVFTRHLVEAISSGAADLDEDGDIALDELYSYVYDQVVAEVPQQRPKKQEDVDGRILIARNVHWTLPTYLTHAVDSPIATQRLNAMPELEHLHQVGNDIVRAAVVGQLTTLADDDSRSVSEAATALLGRIRADVDPPAPPAPPLVAPPVPQPPAPPSAPPPPPARRPLVVPPVEVPTAAVRVVAPPVPVPPVTASPVPSQRVVQPRPGPEVAAAEAQPETRATWWRDPLSLVLGLVVLSALPIILSRVLSFESTAPYTADGFGSSNLPWVLAVVVPLALGAVLLALRKQLAWAVPPASGLILGAGLVLTETSAFWAAFFVEQSDSYDPGPALFSLFAGWAVIGAAAVVIMTRTPLGTRAAIVNDWRIVWALVVLACVVVSMVTLSEAETPWVWIENNSGPVVVGLAALPLTLLVLRTDQAVAGLVAVTVLAFWLLYYLVRDYVQQLTGIEPGTRMTEIVCLLLAVAVCYLAQVRALRGPAATEPAPR